ncbi:MAG TPA: bifunctional 3-(3-hydroxy-phenyl)propionate/3-hydroxycinnamic acid hydroxylase [Alphaproteobacteria bacterium]
MTIKADYDVAIVGYGPVGAVLAALLAKRGRRVAVIETQSEIFDKPRAIAADHEALRIFQWCGLGDVLPGMIGRHPGTDFLGVDGKIIRKYDPQPPPFPLDWLPTGTFVQPELEAKLRAAVERSPQVRVFKPCEAVGIDQDGEAVTLSLRGTDGRPATVTARYLAGCDGAGSFVRKQLALPLEDLAFDEWWIVVDTLLHRDVTLPERCVQYCWPSRPATFIIGPRNVRRWEIKLLPGERPEDFGDPKSILECLARFVDVSALEIWRAAVYRFHALVAARWRQGRAFIVGDAAHQMPPFLGQGLCSGLRDAANLAWKLDLALRHDGADRVLDSYELERKPHIRELVEVTKSFGLVIGELDADKARRRDAELREQLERGTAITVRQRYIPPLKAGLIDTDVEGRPTRGAGTLFVQPRLRMPGGETARLDDVVGDEFLLATHTDAAQSWLDEEAAALLRRIGAARVVIASNGAVPTTPAPDGVVRLVEAHGLFAAWAGEQACEAVLVRPDRYVCGVASDATGLNRLIKSLGRQLFR